LGSLFSLKILTKSLFPVPKLGFEYLKMKRFCEVVSILNDLLVCESAENIGKLMIKVNKNILFMALVNLMF
jgi:hypothetical protein